MKRRWTRLLFLFLIAACSLLAGSLAWLLASERGLHYLVAASTPYVPAQLLVGSARGNLLDGVSVNDFYYTDAYVHVHVGEAQLSLDLLAAVRGDLVFDVGELGDAQVVVFAAQQSSSAPFHFPGLPFTLAVRAGTIVDGSLVVNGSVADQRFDMSELTWSGEWTKQKFDLTVAQLRSPQIELNGAVHFAVDTQTVDSLQAAWKITHAADHPIAGTTSAHGALANLHITTQLTAPLPVIATVTTDLLQTPVQWQGDVTLPLAPLRSLNSNLNDIQASSHIKFHGDSTRTELDTKYAIKRGSENYRGVAHLSWQNQRLAIRDWSADVPTQKTPLHLRGAIDFAPAEIAVDIAADWQNWHWPVGAKNAVDLPSGSARVSGTFDNYQFAAQSHAQAPWSDAEVIAIGRGTTRNVLVEQFKLSGPQADIRASGNVDWEKDLSVGALGNWRNIQWQQDPSNTFASQQGFLHLAGDGTTFSLALQSDVSSNSVPPVKLSLGGVLTTDNFAIRALNVETLDGVIRGHAQVDFSAPMRWQTNLYANGLNFARQWPDFPSNAGAHIAANGIFDSTKPPHISLVVDDINGSLRQLPLSGKLALAMHDKQWSVEPLALRVGKNFVVTEGGLRDSLELSWQIHVSDFSQLQPDWRGSLRGRGSISGNPAQPVVNAALDGDELQLLQAQVARLHVDAAINLSQVAALQSSVNINIAKARYAQLAISELQFNLSGMPQNHHANIYANVDNHAIYLAADGGYTDNTWRGQLTDGYINLKQYGVWQALFATDVSISTQQSTLAPWCWSGDRGQACIQASRDENNAWQAELSAPDLALSLIQPAVNERFTPSGRVSLAAKLHGGDGMATTGAASVVSPEGKLRFSLPDQEPIEWTYRDAQAVAVLTANELQATSSVDLGAAGNARGQLAMAAPRQVTDIAKLPITGTLQLVFRSFEVLPLFLPGVEQTHGELTSELVLSGNLQSPVAQGTIKIRQASAQLPQLGVQWRDISVTADLQSDRAIAFVADVHSGDGALQLKGRANYVDLAAWRFVAELKGTQFLAVNLPDYWVIAEPDLSFAATPEAININGAVAIPAARIEPKDLSTAVRPSRDVVIVDAPPDEQRQTSWPIYSLVRIDLGDNVKFKGFELRARFGGSIAIMDAPGKLTSGSGELRIENGQYRKLNIERGRLIFVGGPLTDPGLDVRASKQVNDITVGFNVRGTLSEPLIRVFSSPAMSETDALSYILLGRPIRQADAQESQMLKQASVSLEMFGAQHVLDRLTKPLGIEDVSIDTDTEGRNSLTLGRYLSPRLYVGYGLGSVNTLLMRYKLSARWSIEAESATTSTATDLLYTLETK